MPFPPPEEVAVGVTQPTENPCATPLRLHVPSLPCHVQPTWDLLPPASPLSFLHEDDLAALISCVAVIPGSLQIGGISYGPTPPGPACHCKQPKTVLACQQTGSPQPGLWPARHASPASRGSIWSPSGRPGSQGPPLIYRDPLLGASKLPFFRPNSAGGRNWAPATAVHCRIPDSAALLPPLDTSGFCSESRLSSVPRRY